MSEPEQGDARPTHVTETLVASGAIRPAAFAASAAQDKALAEGRDEPLGVSAYYSGTLFARASGYITTWQKDIGAHVMKGETLATISAPDLDQQLEEARAQLVQLKAAVEQAQANADLGKVTDARTSQLVTQGWSSSSRVEEAGSTMPTWSRPWRR